MCVANNYFNTPSHTLYKEQNKTLEQTKNIYKNAPLLLDIIIN